MCNEDEVFKVNRKNSKNKDKNFWDIRFLVENNVIYENIYYKSKVVEMIFFFGYFEIMRILVYLIIKKK